MQGAVILNIRPFSDFNPFVVAAQHRPKPNARIYLEAHAANHDRGFGVRVAEIGAQGDDMAGDRLAVVPTLLQGADGEDMP